MPQCNPCWTRHVAAVKKQESWEGNVLARTAESIQKGNQGGPREIRHYLYLRQAFPTLQMNQNRSKTTQGNQLSPQQELEVIKVLSQSCIIKQPRIPVGKRDLAIFALESGKPISQVFGPRKACETLYSRQAEELTLFQVSPSGEKNC